MPFLECLTISLPLEGVIIGFEPKRKYCCGLYPPAPIECESRDRTAPTMPLLAADRVIGEDGLLTLHYLVASKRLGSQAADD